MDLPFSQSQFLAVFTTYNEAVWPLQVVFVVAAIGVVVGVWRNASRWSRPALVVLGALWLWMGFVYHAIFFRPINPAAVVFAALFVAQGGLLLLAATRSSVVIRPSSGAAGFTGLGLVGFALAIYPALGYVTGHTFPHNPTFGLPCPTTLFTLGVLLWTRPLKPTLFVVPLVWSLIGVSAAVQLGMHEDISLIVAGMATVLILLLARREGTESEQNAVPA